MDRIFVETNDLDTGNKIDLQKFLGPPSPTWQETVLAAFYKLEFSCHFLFTEIIKPGTYYFFPTLKYATL